MGKKQRYERSNRPLVHGDVIELDVRMIAADFDKAKQAVVLQQDFNLPLSSAASGQGIKCSDIDGEWSSSSPETTRRTLQEEMAARGIELRVGDRCLVTSANYRGLNQDDGYGHPAPSGNEVLAVKLGKDGAYDPAGARVTFIQDRGFIHSVPKPVRIGHMEPVVSYKQFVPVG
jgi:hypothetical protein